MAPLDGSTQAEAVLVPAAYLCAALSAPLQGTLHIVQVTGLSTSSEKDQKDRVTVVRQQTLSEAHAYLSSAKQRLHDSDLKHLNLVVTSSVAVHMDSVQVLRSIAGLGKGLEALVGNSRCDVIAVAMDGRKSRERRLTKSMSERLLGATKFPLFIAGTLTSGGSFSNRTDVEIEKSGQSRACNALKQS